MANKGDAPPAEDLTYGITQQDVDALALLWLRAVRASLDHAPKQLLMSGILFGLCLMMSLILQEFTHLIGPALLATLLIALPSLWIYETYETAAYNKLERLLNASLTPNLTRLGYDCGRVAAAWFLLLLAFVVFVFAVIGWCPVAQNDATHCFAHQWSLSHGPQE